MTTISGTKLHPEARKGSHRLGPVHHGEWRHTQRRCPLDPELQSLAVQLADNTVRNTAGLVADRIASIRGRKRDADTIAELENIINELIDDKNELVRIAQAFEQQLVAQQLSAENVDYITRNLVPVIKRLAELGGTDSNVDEMLALVEPILSVETLTVMQLMGFNFRRAIGEPLTELVRGLILAQKPEAGRAADLQLLDTQRDTALFELAKDPEAFDRLKSMIAKN